MKDLRLLALSATVFVCLSCTADKPEYGPTIDEIDIIEIDHSKDEPTISHDECLKMAGVTGLMAQKAEAYTKATSFEENDGKAVLFNCVYV